MDFLRVLSKDNYRTYKNHLIDIINECNYDSVVIDLVSAHFIDLTDCELTFSFAVDCHRSIQPEPTKPCEPTRD